MAGQWELRITRIGEQTRNGRRRTVGRYQVFHDGAPVSTLKGALAETKGPGANAPAGNKRCIVAGTYNLHIQAGTRYVTIGYTSSLNHATLPRPGLLLLPTDQRVGILIHPGRGFLSSIGCLNPADALASPTSDIAFIDSRKRVIALIDDLKSFIGSGFPTQAGAKIPRAKVVIQQQ
jgi:hypothetical protein